MFVNNWLYTLGLRFLTKYLNRMSTANCYYLKSFYLEVNLHVFFKPSTFPHEQKWSQYKSLSLALMLGHPLFYQALLPEWLFSSGASDCVFLAHKPGFAPLVLCWLTSSKCWILNHHSYNLGSVAFWALYTLSNSSLCLTSLIFCYFFSFVCSLSPVSLVHSMCLFNFVHWLVCSFIPPLINSKRIWGTGFHFLPLPFLLLSLTNFLSRNPIDLAEKDRIPSKATKKTISIRKHTPYLQYLLEPENGNKEFSSF